MADNIEESLLAPKFDISTIMKRPSPQEPKIFSFDTGRKRSSTSSESTSITASSKVKKPKWDLDYVASPREMRRLKTDLVESRNTILNLESQIQQMHNVRMELQLIFQNETKVLKQQHNGDRASIKILEEQLESARQKEAKLKQQLAEVNNNYSKYKLDKDEEVQELEKSLSEMKEESKVFDDEENAEIVSLNRRLSELQTMLENSDDEIEGQKVMIAELERQLRDRTEQVKDFEKTNQELLTARLKVKELEYHKENYVALQEKVKSNQKPGLYLNLEKKIENLEEENQRLKDLVKNKLVLEEEVHNLTSRLVTFKEQEKKLYNLKMQQTQIEMYLDEWRAVARGICEATDSDASLPHLLRNAVERLQHQEISLTSSKVELESQLSAAVYEAKVAKTDLEKSQKFIEEMKNTMSQKQTLFNRMQKKILLLSRERDSYRVQLDSYEKDLTLNQTTANAVQLQPQKDRIEALETIVESYRELNAKLEADLQHNQLNSEGVSDRVEEISQYRREIAQLKLENEKLAERKDQLEIQLEHLAVGENSLRGGQIFHKENNPISECLIQREQVLEEQEKEIDKLKRKILAMENGLEASKLEEPSPDVKALKEQIKNHDSQTQRMKDFFKSSMQEFRNVIYMLLGYKVDRSPTSIYKLQSVYAEHAHDQICFQVNSEGDLSLLENEFSSGLEEMINLHLRHQKSIPVFLSSLTINLFNNSTMATKTLEIE